MRRAPSLRIAALIAFMAAGLLPLSPASSAKLDWQPWSPGIFEHARAEKRLVILDLEAVWCHWCHVMESETYANPGVSKLLADKFLTVRADQDANPDLSSRYGDWGWPATIIFAPDGTELAKLRGYQPPERMASLLKAFIDDPTPGPSAEAADAIEPASSPLIPTETRAKLSAAYFEGYDAQHGGWTGLNKFVDTDSMSYALHLANEGDTRAAGMVKQTLDGAQPLIDPVWGGVYQYSETADWKTPHYEKIMWYQAHALAQYSQAYALWHRPQDLKAAAAVKDYLTRFMTSPDGGFYTSQDADVSHELTGKTFYALDASKRASLGIAPHIDTHIYARENGWAIAGLVAYANATGDAEALARAVKAAEFIGSTRALPGGGFRHGDTGRGGPYLADTLAMGEAALALYQATGTREWLDVARNAAAFIVANFKHKDAGFLTAVEPEAKAGVLATPVRALDEQPEVARFLNLTGQYAGDESLHAAAELAVRYVLAPAVLESGRPLPGLLLADAELFHEPTHITIVGHKDDALAQALHAAARLHAVTYTRLDWWDKREGALANPDVTYPELETAAAFVCTNRICSLPAFTVAELNETVAKLRGRSEVKQTGQ